MCMRAAGGAGGRHLQQGGDGDEHGDHGGRDESRGRSPRRLRRGMVRLPAVVATAVSTATAMVRGEVRANSLLARWVPAVMASARGRNATAASSGEKPSTAWKKMEVRRTVPAKMAVTPSMTVVPATSVTTFQVCGAT